MWAFVKLKLEFDLIFFKVTFELDTHFLLNWLILELTSNRKNATAVGIG